MNYKNKYLKYKNKYLNLKTIYGGNTFKFNENDSLKEQINKLILEKTDICCSDDLLRPKIIKLIINICKELYKDKYLEELFKNIYKLFSHHLYKKRFDKFSFEYLKELYQYIFYIFSQNKSEKLIEPEDLKKLKLHIENEILTDNKIDEKKVLDLLEKMPLYLMCALIGYIIAKNYKKYKELKKSHFKFLTPDEKKNIPNLPQYDFKRYCSLIKNSKITSLIYEYVKTKKEIIVCDIDKNILIEILYDIYKTSFEEEQDMLDWINNDVVWPISEDKSCNTEIIINQEELNNLKKYMDELMIEKEKNLVTREKVDKLLNMFPEYYLLWIIGHQITMEN